MGNAIDKLQEMRRLERIYPIGTEDNTPNTWYVGGYYVGFSDNNPYIPTFDGITEECKEAWYLGREDGKGDRLNAESS